MADHLLQEFAVDLTRLRERIEQTLGQGQQEVFGTPPKSARLERIFNLAREEAPRLRRAYIGPEHVLLGLLVENEGVAVDILKEFVTLDAETWREHIKTKEKAQFEKEREDLVALVLGDQAYEIPGIPIF